MYFAEENIEGEMLENDLFMDQVDESEEYTTAMFSSAADLQWIATNSKAETTITFEKNNRYTHGFHDKMSLESRIREIIQVGRNTHTKILQNARNLGETPTDHTLLDVMKVFDIYFSDQAEWFRLYKDRLRAAGFITLSKQTAPLFHHL
jgi:hypothetical protein